MSNPSFKKNSIGYVDNIWEDKGVHTFPKGTCPEVNVRARLEFELV